MERLLDLWHLLFKLDTLRERSLTLHLFPFKMSCVINVHASVYQLLPPHGHWWGQGKPDICHPPIFFLGGGGLEKGGTLLNTEN